MLESAQIEDLMTLVASLDRPALIVDTGKVASIVHECASCVRSTLPAASFARTLIVCAPSDRSGGCS